MTQKRTTEKNMPMIREQYILMKASRSPYRAYFNEDGIAREIDAYDGPTCVRAGVVLGKVYDDLGDAIRDAYRLDARNGVGFRVWRVGHAIPVGATTPSWYRGGSVPRLERPDDAR